MSSNLAHQIEDPDDNFDLGGFDLNLLLVLNALLRFRNLTHAGKELQLSQPATSRALIRLRQMFNDDLLMRGNRSFELTPLAKALAPKVEAALGNISTIFNGRIQAPERFSVAMPDHLGLLLVSNLSGYFREVSPTTVFIPVVGLSNVISQMEDGRIDLVLGIADDTPQAFFCRSLPPVPTVCLSREGHPAANGKIAYSDLGQFLSLRISSTYNTGFGEAYDGLEALRPRGRQTLTVPDIHTAARLVQETDAILVLPVPSARFLAQRYGLETFVPLKGVKPAPYQISMVWHERWHRNGIHAGVRSMIASYILEG
ncbi:LysR family transcriptional regulator [Rhizobium terrae]|uniref:LysR family transcriptional regulator n=1 Tax=Rhizobium terrae TaxID=2171756 RepID=UPI000E3E0814|nr:LysR family transcriptional regulator [Rhizobium terrae]